jgi:adenylate kinase
MKRDKRQMAIDYAQYLLDRFGEHMTAEERDKLERLIARRQKRLDKS